MGNGNKLAKIWSEEENGKGGSLRLPAPPYADYRSQLALQIVSTNVPTAPAGFCCNQPLLATTFGETIRNSCELPAKQQQLYFS